MTLGARCEVVREAPRTFGTYAFELGRLTSHRNLLPSNLILLLFSHTEKGRFLVFTRVFAFRVRVRIANPRGTIGLGGLGETLLARPEGHRIVTWARRGSQRLDLSMEGGRDAAMILWVSWLDKKAVLLARPEGHWILTWARPGSSTCTC